MDLLAEYGPKIEAALARMAPGEKVGWALTPSTLRAGENGEKQVRAYVLTMFTPSPVMGTVIHWQIPFIDPFAPLANDCALLNEQIAKAVDGMRNIASSILKAG